MTDKDRREVDRVLTIWRYLINQLNTEQNGHQYMGKAGENKIHLVIVAERIAARINETL